MKARGDYINGRFVRRRHPNAELRVVDPGDLDTHLGTFPCFTDAIGEAVEAARRAAATDWATPAQREQRQAALVRIRAQLHNRAVPLAELISAETGRPLWDTQQEVKGLRREIDVMLRSGLAELALAERLPTGCEVTFFPRGVVAILAGASQPAASIHADVVAALAVGCTVVLKPSPRTPGLGQLYAELIDEADLPRGVFNLVQGDDELGVRLASHADIDVLLFAGRARSAEQIGEDLTAAHGPSAEIEDAEEPTLEGPPAPPPAPGRAPPLYRARTAGRSVALVLDDANLDEAAVEIAVGACIATGQRATSTRGVLVERRVAGALQERLQRLLSTLAVGHRRRRDVFMGPLICDETKARFIAEAAWLRQHAARQLVRPEQSERAPLELRSSRSPKPQGEESPRGHYVRPGLFLCEAAHFNELLTPERSGPLLLLAELDSRQQVAQLLADNAAPLSHAIFTRAKTLPASLAERALSPLMLFNAPTTHGRSELPLEPLRHLGQPLPAGLLTARALTRACVTVRRESVFDETMLPPGLKLLR